MTYKKTARIAGILFALLLCLFLSGCFDRKEVEDFAYAVAMGLDKGEINPLRLTLQIAMPAKTGEGGEGEEGGSGSGKGGGKSSTLITIEAPSIYSALNIANTYVSKELNLSHLKVIIFSKELAMEGIKKYMNALVRWKEFRPSMFVAVARETALEYLKNAEPVLELNQPKFYELTFLSYEYSGFSANTQFINFYTQQESLDMNPVAVLAGTSDYKSPEDFKQGEYANKGEDGANNRVAEKFKAGDMTIIGDLKAEIAGLAAFKGDSMVGEIDAGESILYLMLTGQFRHSYIAIVDPMEKDDYIVLNVKQSRKPKHTVEVSGDRPEITSKIMLEADILSIQSSINYEEEVNLKKIEDTMEKFIVNGMEAFLDRTVREFKSDIIGFGKGVKGKFLTVQEWTEFGWGDKYENSIFNLDVDLKVRRPGLIVRTSPSK